MGNVGIQACDPTGTLCFGGDGFSISGPGIGITYNLPGCSQSISVGPTATTVTNVCPGSISTATIGISAGDSSVNTSNIGASTKLLSTEIIELKRKNALLGVHTATPPTWTVEEIIRRSTTSNPCMLMGHKITPEYLKKIGEFYNPKGKTIKINVIKLYKKSSERKTIEFTVNTTDTILSLKQKIKTKEWIPEKEQKIFFKSKELLDGYMIGHFITNNNEELFLHSNE
jgi:hypothetical protein